MRLRMKESVGVSPTTVDCNPRKKGVTVMSSLIIDPRDQKFVLYEMLNVEALCKAPLYADFSRDMFDMALNEAEKFATGVIFPCLADGDREGCRLEDGNVRVPKCYHRAAELYRGGGWATMSVEPEEGGQGFPHVVSLAAKEWFSHNSAFVSYFSLTEGAAHLIETYGTEAQKKKYLPKMHAAEWGGTMALTEPGAGTDVGNLKTKAIRQADGTFRLQGTKIFITSGDSDIMENIIHPVLARIEGDPPGTGGISIFLVPKFLVNDDGTLGKRNDYSIGKIEEKMGIHGSATCLINLGDNGECFAELLGEERQGMKIMFQMMNGARIGIGIQSLAGSSIAYLHALKYAKERLQGSSLAEMKNPAAPRVPIIQHPDVRRMLIWMKAHTEGFRALLYFTALCVDHCEATDDEAAKEKYNGFLEVLTPICKAYCSDMAFRVTETAIQVYGGYGYCAEYPVEQFLRDEKIASLYEGTNGIQALDLVGRKLGLKKGMYFMNLLGEMGATIAKYQPALPDLTPDVQAAMNTLAEVAMLFAASGKTGKFLIPVSNAYPFLMLMGQVVMAWMLLWQAGVAKEKLAAPDGGGADRAFYEGKVASARYFIKHVLPEVDAAAKAIQSEDVSMMEIADEAFAS
jgi:alkylation response protein AidB-like acyl-CoA dehydrogenase